MVVVGVLRIAAATVRERGFAIADHRSAHACRYSQVVSAECAAECSRPELGDPGDGCAVAHGHREVVAALEAAKAE